MFDTIYNLRGFCSDLPSGNEEAAAAASARQDMLTKPQGSLGRLEELAIWLARWQGKPLPVLDKVKVLVFAGSHGVTARGVSAFPAEVTGQMVANFSAGGAAINQLARQAGAALDVIALDIERPTGDFTTGLAMTDDDFLAAVARGYSSVDPGLDLVCLGEMGIGNTTAAAACCAGLFGGAGADWVGRGTGVDDDGLARKAAAVDAAMRRHASLRSDPLRMFAAVGGRELAALFGALLAARKNKIPVMLDGFVCTAVAAPLALLFAGGLDHAKCAHRSAEKAHNMLLAKLDMKPLLDMNMRLGEGSGACLAINILRAALACHSGMASFAEAGVSNKA